MNDDFYTHYIDTLKDKINIFNTVQFNKDTLVETLPETSLHLPHSLTLTKKYTNSSEQKTHRDDTMQLNNLLWQQKVAEILIMYHRNIIL